VPFARREGLDLFWELSGPADGEPLLLIRGLSRSSRYWYGLRPLLEKRYRVLVLDNRGIGRSSAAPPFFTTADMADDCAAVLDQSGVHRAHVFGISLGGMVAQHLVLRHPGRVQRLVLGATTMGGRGAQRVPAPAVAAILGVMFRDVDAQIRDTAPWVLAEEHLASHPETVQTWIDLARSEPRRRGVLLGQLLAAARHDTSEHLFRVRAPTLVVTGDRDRLIPMKNSERIAGAIAHSALEILPGAGHDFPTEAPEVVASLLERFLSG